MADTDQTASDDDMSPMEEACFQIIASVGMAKSNYIKAIQVAKDGKLDEARKLVEEGNEAYLQGHEVHMGLLQEDAATIGSIHVSLLLVHSEDQLIQAETFRVIALDFIDLYERLDA
ncbi:MAG: PTS lactose/cellobiose transporter subunit IIA [Olsenella sp.]|jgi:PTS system cellobiose-specific IIA component